MDLIDYVKLVIDTYAASADRLGEFPIGTTKTITAAEILKNYLPAANFAGAISVVEVASGLRTMFVVSNSGAASALDHPLTLANFDGANIELKKTFNSMHSMVYGKLSQDLYNPLHDETIQHFKQTISNTFDGSERLISFVDANRVDGYVRASFLRRLGDIIQPAQVFQTIHTGQQQYWNNRSNRINKSSPGDVQSTGANLYSIMAPIRQFGRDITPVDQDAQESVAMLLSLALATRLRVCVGGDLIGIRNIIGIIIQLLRQRQRIVTTGYLPIIAKHVEQLYLLRFSVYDDNKPADQCGGPGAVFNQLFDDAWRLLKQSRFCAEPKAFGYIRNGNYDGLASGMSSPRLIGQTCFWWTYQGGADNPATYRVVGPRDNVNNAKLAGSYMWPCPSCRNRSGQMIGGLPIGRVIVGNLGKSYEV